MTDTIARVGAATHRVASGVFAPPGWQDAIDNVVDNGREEDLDSGTIIGFRMITGEPNGAHQMNYIHVAGRRDARTGKFIVGSVWLDCQDWQRRSDGKFYVDEWIHQLSPDASRWSPLHYFEVVSSGGGVEDSGSLPQSAGDPRASLARLIAGWAKYRPPSPPAAPAATASDARRASDVLMPAIAAPKGLQPPGVLGLRRR